MSMGESSKAGVGLEWGGPWEDAQREGRRREGAQYTGMHGEGLSCI